MLVEDEKAGRVAHPIRVADLRPRPARQLDAREGAARSEAHRGGSHRLTVGHADEAEVRVELHNDRPAAAQHMVQVAFRADIGTAGTHGEPDATERDDIEHHGDDERGERRGADRRHGQHDPEDRRNEHGGREDEVAVVVERPQR